MEEQVLPRNRFLERRATLTLPEIRQPRNLLILSDLHCIGNIEAYGELKNLLQQEIADYVLFLGDLQAFLEFLPPAVDWLASIPAKRGKFAVLGNRERCVPWMSAEDWKSVYAKAGFHCLVNETFDPGPGEPLFFGADDFRFSKPDWTACRKLSSAERCVISLSHNPDAVAEEGANFVGKLSLCGHTHGGQICLPWLGALYTSSIYGRQFLRGWKQRKDQTLCHITAGLGESGFGFYRRRVLCPPEFSRIQLQGTSHI